MHINEIIDRYEALREQREPKLQALFSGAQPFIVMQMYPADLYGACNTVPYIVQNNLAYLEASVKHLWTDDLPFLEPWIGTGAYANAYGCDYLWRDDNAPDVHYRYFEIEDVVDLPYPDWRDSPVMRMVLECIDALKEATLGRIPICLTDTQSPFDTATLILDAVTLFTACYTHREVVMDVMDNITRLIIEFSQVQALRIGEGLVARPGHLAPSSTAYKGMSMSDDNLAVSSPKINEIVALPFNQKIAEAMGGLALHSCGKWAHTMAKLDKADGYDMVECAITNAVDPTPNKPEDVRDALRGKDILCKVRVGNDMDQVEDALQRVFAPDLPLIVQLDYDAAHARENYERVTALLDSLYSAE